MVLKLLPVILLLLFLCQTSVCSILTTRDQGFIFPEDIAVNGGGSFSGHVQACPHKEAVPEVGRSFLSSAQEFDNLALNPFFDFWPEESTSPPGYNHLQSVSVSRSETRPFLGRFNLQLRTTSSNGAIGQIFRTPESVGGRLLRFSIAAANWTCTSLTLQLEDYTDSDNPSPFAAETFEDEAPTGWQSFHLSGTVPQGVRTLRTALICSGYAPKSMTIGLHRLTVAQVDGHVALATPDGSVGIGTAETQSKLHIKGDAIHSGQLRGPRGATKHFLSGWGSSCREILENDPGVSGNDGPYLLSRAGGVVPVHCDMTTLGGGWQLGFKYSGFSRYNVPTIIDSSGPVAAASPANAFRPIAEDRREGHHRPTMQDFFEVEGKEWMVRMTYFGQSMERNENGWAYPVIANNTFVMQFSGAATLGDLIPRTSSITDLSCRDLGGTVNVTLFDRPSGRWVNVGATDTSVWEPNGRNFLALNHTRMDLPSGWDGMDCGRPADKLLFNEDSMLDLLFHGSIPWVRGFEHLFYRWGSSGINIQRCAWNCWVWTDPTLGFSAVEFFAR